MSANAYVDGDTALEMVRAAGGDTLYAIGLLVVYEDETELVPGAFFCASLDDAQEITAGFDTPTGIEALIAASKIFDDAIGVGDEVCVICEICENADLDDYDVERLLLESPTDFRGEHYFVKQPDGTYECGTRILNY